MKNLLLLLMTVFVFTSVTYSQSFMFDPFEDLPTTGRYAFNAYGVNDTSAVTLSLDSSNPQQGTNALKFDWVVQRAEGWGGYCKIELFHPDSNSVWDLSPFEYWGLWYNIQQKSTSPTRVQFRMELYDVSDAPVTTYDAGQTEFYYSFEYILDDEPGWKQILLPLKDVGGAAFNGSSGFYRTGWAGITGNNTLDLNKIKGFGMEISIDGPQDFSFANGSMLLDNWTFEGSAAVNLVFFNGKAIPSGMRLDSWNGSLDVEVGAGYTPGTNALKWMQGPGQSWTGFLFTFAPKFMSYRWNVDSLKFKIKAPSGVGTLRAQFVDANDNAVKHLISEPSGGYGGDWKMMAIPLRDINQFERGTSFDTSKVIKFEFMAEGTGNGSTIYFDDWWTGNPSIDVLPPAAPTVPVVVAGDRSNLVIWGDVSGESGETYNIFYSRYPITDLKSPNVDVVEQGLGVAENVGSINHLLFSPGGDSTVSYYYAITAVDAAGNESVPAVTETAVSNVAKGVATISLAAPVFKADGSLTEWAHIKPIRFFPSEGAHIATNFKVDSDDDLSALVYMAADAEYFYIAFDVNDDVVDVSSTTSYLQDSPDMFLGTYNWHGPAHKGYGRGAQPDYQMRFNKTNLIIGTIGDYVLLTPGENYYWQEKFPAGYIIEARFKWADLAVPGNDAVFVPVEGFRIPLDFSFNDADNNPAGSREGIMSLSPYNNDTSWSSPLWWVYTWIGNKSFPVGVEQDNPQVIVNRYELEQNYPNPFNPVTTINYSLAQASDVKLEIYNMLGQKIKTLVNTRQAQGVYRVQFDGQELASGLYFYRLQAGSFVQIRKMALMK